MKKNTKTLLGIGAAAAGLYWLSKRKDDGAVAGLGASATDCEVLKVFLDRANARLEADAAAAVGTGCFRGGQWELVPGPNKYWEIDSPRCSSIHAAVRDSQMFLYELQMRYQSAKCGSRVSRQLPSMQKSISPRFFSR